MEKKFIKPAEGKTVFDHNAKRNISTSGQMVIMDSQWHRYLAAGDIEVIDNPEILNQKALQNPIDSKEDSSKNLGKAKEPEKSKPKGRGRRNNVN